MRDRNKQLQHLHIRITGHVQGVFFRTAAKQQAEGLGINGLARNNPDGSVTIEAEGDSETLREFLDWCSVGPSKARVEHVEVEEGGLQHFDSFRVV
jgi:acylphosphatase